MLAEDEYLHGFTDVERRRLVGQAEVLGPAVFSKIDFSSCNHIYEPGCGVGAQTLQLLQKFPHLHITSVEKSPSQVEGASVILKEVIERKSVTLIAGDAMKTGLASESMDGAFICWLLEHLPSPVGVLQEVYRLLKPAAAVFATEVFNPSLFFYPACPSISKYWQIFSDYQKRLKGDPCVGMRLGNFLTDAGFRDVDLWPITFILDKRQQDYQFRTIFLNYWWDLFMSAKDGLAAQGLIDSDLLARMSVEFNQFRTTPDLVFYAAAMQARAVK